MKVLSIIIVLLCGLATATENQNTIAPTTNDGVGALAEQENNNMTEKGKNKEEELKVLREENSRKKEKLKVVEEEVEGKEESEISREGKSLRGKSPFTTIKALAEQENNNMTEKGKNKEEELKVLREENSRKKEKLKVVEEEVEGKEESEIGREGKSLRGKSPFTTIKGWVQGGDILPDAKSTICSQIPNPKCSGLCFKKGTQPPHYTTTKKGHKKCGIKGCYCYTIDPIWAAIGDNEKTIGDLQKDNEKLSTEVELLQAEDEKLKEDNEKLKTTIIQCAEQNSFTGSGLVIKYDSFTYSYTTTGSGGLDPVTGVFSAPVTGSYLVTWSLYAGDDAGDPYVNIFLRKDGINLDYTNHVSQYTGQTGLVYDQGGRTVMIGLAAGQTIDLYCADCDATVYGVLFCVQYIAHM